MEQEDIIKDLQTLPNKLFKFGMDYAEKKSCFNTIDEQKKTILADIKNRIAFDYAPEKVSEAQLEREALASNEYKQYLFGRGLAERLYLKSQATYNALQVKVDCTRSLNSLRKVEANLL